VLELRLPFASSTTVAMCQFASWIGFVRYCSVCSPAVTVTVSTTRRVTMKYLQTLSCSLMREVTNSRKEAAHHGRTSSSTTSCYVTECFVTFSFTGLGSYPISLEHRVTVKPNHAFHNYLPSSDSSNFLKRECNRISTLPGSIGVARDTTGRENGSSGK
jgi:hypothetical protein